MAKITLGGLEPPDSEIFTGGTLVFTNPYPDDPSPTSAPIDGDGSLPEEGNTVWLPVPTTERDVQPRATTENVAQSSADDGSAGVLAAREPRSEEMEQKQS